jgi:hypothetical protein
MPIQRDIHLGLLFDETGDRPGPIHATKGGNATAITAG